MDKERIQGAWEVAEVYGLDGEDAEDAARTGYWFSGDRLITGDSEAAWEWPFRLNESSRPKQLVTWSENDGFPFSPKALYDFQDGNLILCYKPYPDVLPISFESNPDSGNVVVRLVRSTRPIPQ